MTDDPLETTPSPDPPETVKRAPPKEELPVETPVPTQSPEPPETVKRAPPKIFYGKTNAQHGVHLAPPAGPQYTHPEVADLYQRLKKVFKEIGHEF